MYSTALWDAWVKQEMQNYQQEKNGKKVYHKKGYLHLDQRFWFPERHSEIEDIIKNKLLVPNPQRPQFKQFYSFSPFLKIIAKTPRYRYQFEEGHYDLETKERPICFAAHTDSLILSYYSFALTRTYEAYIKRQEFDDVVLAYRSDLGKCNIQFAKEAFDQVKARKECSAIALDIKGYFDNIDHEKLLEKWQKVVGGRLSEDQMRLYKVLTQYSYIKPKSLLKKYKNPKKRNEKPIATLMDVIPRSGLLNKFKRLKQDKLIVKNELPNDKTNRMCGIPQGSPISALLSNIFLIDFDADLKQKSITEGFVVFVNAKFLAFFCKLSAAKIAINQSLFRLQKWLEAYCNCSHSDQFVSHRRSTSW